MTNSAPANTSEGPAYLVFDTESIPDGILLSKTKYPDQGLGPEAAVARAQEEARAQSPVGSDFLPVTYQIPVAVCVARVSADFRLRSLRCIDTPLYRPREIVEGFWSGLAHYKAKLVSFNGRGFDLPLMEFAAYRYGIAAPHHFRDRYGARHRYGEAHIDLMELLSNFGAIRLPGGLNLFSKLLGKPGKTDTTGYQVYDMFRQGQVQAINEYCSFDVLDTYFVFLRTRVLTGDLPLEQEQERVRETKDWLSAQTTEQPHLQRYLDRWGDWEAWP